jgi:hypothetical protein
MLPWLWAVTDDGTDKQRLWPIGPGVHQTPRGFSPLVGQNFRGAYLRAYFRSNLSGTLNLARPGGAPSTSAAAMGSHSAAAFPEAEPRSLLCAYHS